MNKLCANTTEGRPQNGFTLIEIMIALAISGLLLVGLTKIYTTMVNSYSLQDQLTEMNQNAKFTIKEISDVLMQSGADCGAVNGDTLDKDTIILSAASNDFTIKVNPRGGVYTIPRDTIINTSTPCSLKVDNAYAFRLATKIGHVPAMKYPAVKVKTYTLLGIDSANNKLCISGGIAGDNFYQNDAVYSFTYHRYYLNGTDLCLDSSGNVLAENIDSLKVTFLDSAGTATTKWTKMSFVNLIVESMTNIADNRYNGYADHRRRLKLTYQFRLKNKV